MDGCWILNLLARAGFTNADVSSVLDDNDQATREDVAWLIDWETFLAGEM